MKSTLSLLAVLLVGALPIAAGAAEPAKSPPALQPGTAPAPPAVPDAGKIEVPPMFKELDQNKDGQITKDEAKRSAETLARFDSLDTDHNGKVSLLEWNAGEKQKTPLAKP